MTQDPNGASPLFYRLRLLQRTLPLSAALFGIGYEIVEHRLLTDTRLTPIAFFEILFFSVIGPLLIFLLLTWLLARVAERDAAEARLSVLYEVSHQSAAARSLSELQELALSIPERVGLSDASSVLVVQEGPGKPWLLAGTRGFGREDIAALQAELASKQDQAICVMNQADATYVRFDCPLLRRLATQTARAPQLAFSLSLSREPARTTMLGVYRPKPSILPPQIAETLEPLAAGLAMALDRASFRARERQLLQQVRQSVAAEQQGLVPTLAQILANIADDLPIEAAAIYLVHDGHERKLTCAVSWPDSHACESLSEAALVTVRALGEAVGARTDVLETPEALGLEPPLLALPITSDGKALGVLVFAGQASAQLPPRSILDIVASTIALLIRNSQLYRRLETQAVLEERNHLAREVHDGIAQALAFYNFKVQQVQRLLSRRDVAEATSALEELRGGSQEVYEEVRWMIQDLGGVLDDRGDLVALLRDYCPAFATRSGLEVSLDVVGNIELPPETQLELFRVAQEALNNAHRHAHASRVSVRLCQGVGGVEMMVEDDGVGLAPGGEAGDHLGLRIMRERVRSTGGELQVFSRDGEGTAVRVLVPLPPEGQRREEGLWSVSLS